MATNGDEYYLFVNSDDRVNRAEVNPFTVEIKNLNFMYNRNIRIGLDEIYFQHLQYPIRSTNNQFQISDDGVAWYTITIPQGSYTPAQFIAALKTQLDSSASAYVYTVTWDDVLRRISIAIPLPNSFWLRFNGINSAHKALGFNDNFQGSQTVATSTQPAILNSDFCVYLTTDFAGSNVLSSYRGAVMEVVDLGVPFGDYVSYKSNETANYEHVAEARLSRISIKLINPDGTTYELPRNASVVIKFRIIATDYA